MAYNEKTIQQVWEKARGIQGRDFTEWRQDQCGAWIKRDQYEHSHSDFGWKIQNTVPGGGKEVGDLQPLHLNNTYDIANREPHCKVTADRTDLAPTQSVNNPRNKNV